MLGEFVIYVVVVCIGGIFLEWLDSFKKEKSIFTPHVWDKYN